MVGFIIVYFLVFANAKPLSRKVFYLNTDCTDQRDFSLALVINIPIIPNICG